MGRDLTKVKSPSGSLSFGTDVRFNARTTIRATPARVWDVLSDWDRQAAWMPDVAWMQVLGSGRELGARVQVRTKIFGVPLATDLIEVTAWEPPRRLAVRHVGVVIGTGEWRVEPVDEGVAFTWIEAVRMRPWILGDVALWLYRPWQRAMVRRSMRNLARLCEGAG